MGEDGKCIWWIGSWCILCCVMSLGYWKLRSFKYVLLGKWLWRFSLETDNFWKWLVVVKYGEKEEERALNYVCYLHRVGVWKGIRESWETFSRYITFITGDGRKVQFWFDGLCMDQALIDIFKELISNSSTHNGNGMWLYGDYLPLWRGGNAKNWSPAFVRPV